MREKPIKLEGYAIYDCLFTSKYLLDRAEAIAELKLHGKQLEEWREKRSLGKVRVKLESEYMDKAEDLVP